MLARNLLFASLLVIVAAGTLLAQSNLNGEESSANSDYDQYIYVCNQGEATLTVIDASKKEIADRIDLQKLGFSSNAKPHHAVAEPDGSFWYVTLIGENRVLKFNRRNELVGQTNLEVPGLLELHPKKDLLLVGRSMSAVNPPQSVGLIRRSDMTLLKEVPTFFARPHATAISPDGQWTYIASLADNQIISRNNETGETELTSLDGDPHVFVDFAISPDGSTLVLTGQVSGKLLIFDLSNPSSPNLTDTVNVNAQPWHPVFSPNGRYVYFGNKQDHTVTAVDMETKQVATVIKGNGLAQPHGSALSSDGKYLFISNNNRQGTYKGKDAPATDNPPGTITVINTETYEIVKVIELGIYPSGIGTNTRW